MHETISVPVLIVGKENGCTETEVEGVFMVDGTGMVLVKVTERLL